MTDRLTAEDHDTIAAELDALREEIMSGLGERDAAYIRRVIRWQRGLEIDKVRAGEADEEVTKEKLRAIGRKIRRQWGKDYLAFPLLTGPQFLSTLAANFTANAVRNVWAHMIIFCGHFPGDVEVFERERLDGETKGEWYVRQMRGSADIKGGALFHLMTGNLSHQIEHHLFPDMPSNRYAEIAPRVRALAEKYDLPYHTGSLSKQVSGTWKKIFRHALPGPGGRAVRRPKAVRRP